MKGLNVKLDFGKLFLLLQLLQVVIHEAYLRGQKFDLIAKEAEMVVNCLKLKKHAIC